MGQHNKLRLRIRCEQAERWIPHLEQLVLRNRSTVYGNADFSGGRPPMVSDDQNRRARSSGEFCGERCTLDFTDSIALSCGFETQQV